MTLADFLRARLDEDEAVARAATPGPWRVVESYGRADVEGGHRPATSSERGEPWQSLIWSDDHDAISVPDATHIACHDPARVLADVEAKRAIIEWHESWPVLMTQPPTIEHVDDGDLDTFAVRASQQIAWLTEQEYRNRFGTEPPSGPILRLLAQPYRDHPDWRPEWSTT